MSKVEDRREKLQVTIDDSVSNLLYYDRKEDEDLQMGVIEEMVEKGEVTVDEMIEWYATPLRAHFTKKRTL
jgi:hypothetical protein